MNIQQWESTPMSAATRKECNECARREYVAMLTRELTAGLNDAEEISMPSKTVLNLDDDTMFGFDEDGYSPV